MEVNSISDKELVIQLKPAKLLEKYPERFRLMHVKDLKKGVKRDL